MNKNSILMHYLLLFFLLLTLFSSNSFGIIVKEDLVDMLDVDYFTRLLWFGDCYSINGVGNNLKSPLFGSSERTLRRELEADYADGIEEMVEKAASARMVSNAFAAETVEIENQLGASNWLWAFGQIVDHDLSMVEPGIEEMHIPYPPGDIFEGFIPFTRTVPAETTRDYLNHPRQQTNVLTSFLDLSSVYGSSCIKASALRGENGKLLTSEGDMLPFNYLVDGNYYINNDNGIPGVDPNQFFLAGDIRSNEFVTLTSIHTLFLREHNRLADLIAEAAFEEGRELTDDDIYYIARLINIWQYQTIVFGEFLPALIGTYAPNPNMIDYDVRVDATISNEFTTAAYRLGHSLLTPNISIVNEFGETMEFPVREGFFQPQKTIELGVENILRGLSAMKCRELDTMIIDDLRNFLFTNIDRELNALDLASLNIQRGRDHGLPGFHAFVELYRGIDRDDVTFADITSDLQKQGRLSNIYTHPKYIDPWIGLLIEDKEEETMSQAGPTLSRLIANTFERLVAGDRCFYYHHDLRLPFSRFKTTLKELLLYNTNIQDSEVPDNVFYVV